MSGEYLKDLRPRPECVRIRLTRKSASCRLPSRVMSSPGETGSSVSTCKKYKSGPQINGCEVRGLHSCELTDAPGEQGVSLGLVGLQHRHTPVVVHLVAAVDGRCAGRAAGGQLSVVHNFDTVANKTCPSCR